MNARPVRKYRTPKYPGRLQVIANPGLLRQHIPGPWRKVPEMASAVAIFLAANAGSVKAGDQPGGNGKALAILAPVFEHGEGRGVTGCVVVSPPAFLSEEEVMQVIQEELGKNAVQISQKEAELAGVNISRTMESYRNNRTQIEKVAPAKPLTVLRLDTKKPAAVQVITQKNYYTLGGPLSAESVQSYDTKGLAKSLGEQVKKDAKEPVYMGIFYDPMARAERPPAGKKTAPGDWRKYYEASNKMKKAESQRLLRLQVQDFMKWLQGQGVI